MADCIQQDTNVLATAPSASRGPGVKKGQKMLLGIKTVKSTGGKTNDKDMNAAKMVVTGNPKMTMSKNDSTSTFNNPCCSVV